MARESYSTQQAKIEKEISKLKKKAEALQLRRRKPVLASIVKNMRDYAITPEEVAAAFGKTPAKRLGGAKSAKKPVSANKVAVAPKYRHPQTGATWTGRGKPPRWLSDAESAGTPRSTFLIPVVAQNVVAQNVVV